MRYLPHEERTIRFYQWEKRGRGVLHWGYPVFPEPPFSIYRPYDPQKISWHDDSVSDGILRSIAKKSLPFLFEDEPEPKLRQAELQTEPQRPRLYYFEYSLVELELVFPPYQDISLEVFEQCLVSLPNEYPITFEIIATDQIIKYILVVQKVEEQLIRNQFSTFLPEIQIRNLDLFLVNEIERTEGPTLVYDYALTQEFMLPTATLEKHSRVDSMTSFLAIISALEPGELVVFQLTFETTTHSWANQMVQSVSVGKESFFINAPDMPKIAQMKTSHPLYAVVARIAITPSSRERHNALYKAVNSIIRISTSPYNSFGLLQYDSKEDTDPFEEEPELEKVEVNKEYEVCLDIIYRRSRRSGMILNSKELLLFIHPPFASLQLKKLKQFLGKTKKVPSEACGHSFRIGINLHQGVETDVTLGIVHRLQHTHIIGATGTGKSTLLEHMVVQDMELGNGCMLLDPHGDLVESLLTRVPVHRLKDVVLIDPDNAQYVTGFNLFSAQTPIEKIILSSDLVALFRRLSASWGDQMNSVLANAIHALLEGRGGTILDLRRFLVEPHFRNQYLQSVTDPSIVYYWEKEFPLLRKNSTAPIITRLDAFLRPSIIRNMMGQREGVDIRKLVEQNKIVLIKLAQGLIGKENSYLLGTLFVAKLNQVVKARQAHEKSSRSPFYLYIDEFQNFITPSMEDILSGARKYGLGLILAHQGLTQLAKADKGVHDAVIANIGTRIVFRVGYNDAKVLEKDFSFFEDEDLQGLSIGQAIVRIGTRTNDCNVTTTLLPEIPEAQALKTRQLVAHHSHTTYSKLHDEIAKKIQETYFKKTSRKNANRQSPVKEESPVHKLPPPPIPAVTSPKTKAPFQETTTDIQQEAEAFKVEASKREEKRQHIYLQSFLKKTAEARGFKAVIEEPTPNNSGRVDVGLFRDGVRIAIEVSVTTPPQHEVQNIQKCVSAGYDQVLSVSSSKPQLTKISTLCKKALSEADLQKVLFLEPRDVISFMDAYTQPQENNENIVKGYKVKVKYISPDVNNPSVNDAVTKVILDAIQRLKIKK